MQLEGSRGAGLFWHVSNALAAGPLIAPQVCGRTRVAYVQPRNLLLPRLSLRPDYLC
jgi:hypothetical protein